MVADTRPAGYGIAPSDAGQVGPVIYARWSIHHSRRATSSGVGAFFLECADMWHLLLPFRQFWALRRRPSGGTIQIASKDSASVSASPRGQLPKGQPRLPQAPGWPFLFSAF